MNICLYVCVQVFKTERDEEKPGETTRKVQVTRISFHLQLSFLVQHCVKGCFMLREPEAL